MNRIIIWLVVLIAFAGGVYLGVFVLNHGIGISPDSVVYIAGARNLLAGKGFSLPSGNATVDPITHHAPFYSMLLAGIGVFGPDPIVSARWLNAGLLSLNLFAGAWIVGKRGRPYGILAILGILLLLSFPNMIEIHSMAWTEPLFILLSLLAGMWMDKALDGKAVYFWLAAAMIGAGFLTRYAGAALIPAGVLVFFLFTPGNLWKRVVRSVSFGLISAIPGVLWAARNYYVADTAANREFLFHPPTLSQLLEGLNTVSSWLLVPEGATALLKAIPILIVGLLIGVYLYQNYALGHSSIQQSRSPAIFFIFMLAYGGFVLFSLTFFDANTPLDGRILSPVFVWSLMVVLQALSWFLTTIKRHPVMMASGAAIAGLILFTLLGSSVPYGMNAYREGLGFNTSSWAQSESLAAVKKLPENLILYTNSIEAVYIQTDRMANRVPSKYQSANRRENPDYDFEMANMVKEIRSGKAVIVWLDGFQRETLPSEDELIRQYQLDPVQVFPDGKIFASPVD